MDDTYVSNTTYILKLFLKSKIIYLLRNPKSVASSYYNLIKEYKSMEYDGTFSGYLPMYMEGICEYGHNYVEDFTNHKKMMMYSF